jgi:urate oxidase
MARAKIEAGQWKRIKYQDQPHRHAFIAGSNEKRVAWIERTRNSAQVHAGIADCEVLKTTDSLFKDFVRDEFTTLPDSSDRILATKINARWKYDGDRLGNLDWDKSFEQVRQAMLDVFCEHHSLSVQQTLYAMGESALLAVPGIEQIEITLPNKHRIPFNLVPLGRTNKNEIFVTTSEPFGEIHAVLRRK